MLLEGIMLTVGFFGAVFAVVWLTKAGIRRLGVGSEPVEGRIVGKHTVTVNFGKGTGVIHKLDVAANGAVRRLDVLEPGLFAQVEEGERVRLWVALNTVVKVDLLEPTLSPPPAPGQLTPKQWEMRQRRLRQRP